MAGGTDWCHRHSKQLGFAVGDSRTCRRSYAFDNHVRLFFKGGHLPGFTFKERQLRRSDSDYCCMQAVRLLDRTTSRNVCLREVIYSEYMRRPF